MVAAGWLVRQMTLMVEKEKRDTEKEGGGERSENKDPVCVRYREIREGDQGDWEAESSERVKGERGQQQYR